ncbi:hypothetical protein V8C35DRAFT_306803 [Trichoderma chlorosporum]
MIRSFLVLLSFLFSSFLHHYFLLTNSQSRSCRILINRSTTERRHIGLRDNIPCLVILFGHHSSSFCSFLHANSFVNPYNTI